MGMRAICLEMGPGITKRPPIGRARKASSDAAAADLAPLGQLWVPAACRRLGVVRLTG
mgnify:CR=1 FL=1